MPTVRLPLRHAYAFGAEKGLAADLEKIRTMEIEWELNYDSTLRRGYVVDLFERNGIFDEFKTRYWTHGNTPDGEKQRRFLLKLKQRYEALQAGEASEAAIESDLEDAEEEQEFAAESDLRDFLIKNLTCIEPGLRLYEQSGHSGREFAIDRGFIDILAVDATGQFVVIELKVSRGRNKTLGQILYYMGWVDENLAKGRACRGIVIAKEISDDLKLATKRAPDIKLLRYKLSVSVESAN